MAEPIVEIEQGKLRGKKCDSFFFFKGIPYAKPPVGELRFLAPVSPESWDGVRDATKDCNVCAQLDSATGSVTGSEDCLYLNVSTPILPPGDLLPVMFFIHGGGFIYGNGTDESSHGPDYLVKKNIVVVTINYRLGAFGFLCLDRKEATGNMGLRDQVQALKWVQKNIKQFGGDPTNVTIFGISAGGASVEYLILSPMAKGLFHKAIAQSGSSLVPWAQNNKVRELSRKIPSVKGKTVEDDTELLQYIKDMPTKDLIEAFMMVTMKAKHQGGINFGFVPTIEKTGDWEAFLDKSPYSIMTEGTFSKVPFITGFCSREGLILDSVMFNAHLKKMVAEKNFFDYIGEFFGIDESKKKEFNEKLSKIYPDVNKFDEVDSYAIDFFSDVDFIGGIYTAACWMEKHNPSIYLYEFSYDGNLNYLKKKINIHRKGAAHGDESGYVLKAAILESKTITETDNLVRNRVLEMWSNFAKYGDPTKNINKTITTKWERLGTDINYLLIDDNLTVKQDPYPERTRLFKSLYETFYSKK